MHTPDGSDRTEPEYQRTKAKKHVRNDEKGLIILFSSIPSIKECETLVTNLDFSMMTEITATLPTPRPVQRYQSCCSRRGTDRHRRRRSKDPCQGVNRHPARATWAIAVILGEW